MDGKKVVSIIAVCSVCVAVVAGVVACVVAVVKGVDNVICKTVEYSCNTAADVISEIIDA